jgi:hypothetical protein
MMKNTLVGYAALGIASCTAAAQVGIGGGVPVPLADIVFVIDQSGSIEDLEFEAFRDAIAATIGSSIPATKNYRVAVVSFTTTGTVEIPLTPANSATLVSDIHAIPLPGSGQTDVEEGLLTASTIFVSEPIVPNNRQVIVLTDASSGQFQDSGDVADDLRTVLGARVSVGLVETDPDLPTPCDSLSNVFCPGDSDPGSGFISAQVFEALLTSNAPVNAPFVGPIAGSLLPGVLGCIPDSDLDEGSTLLEYYLPFLDEALCPILHTHLPDADSNGVPDICDVPIDGINDCNGDGIEDGCQFIFDCNDNGIFDECEGFDDCNTNGIPDLCEPDCDEDGLIDDCDPDLDGDGILDIHDQLIGPCDGGTGIDGEPIGP